MGVIPRGAVTATQDCAAMSLEKIPETPLLIQLQLGAMAK
jgi:hypothetical protein